MKHSFPFVWPAALTITSLLAGWLLMGCATEPKIDWSARVGNFTFDQAVAEQGPPDKTFKFTDGAMLAEWIRPQQSHTSIGFGTGFYGGGTGVAVGSSVGSGYYERVLRLTFGPDGQLKEWKKFSQ